MDVVFAPRWGSYNPYPRKLAEALGKLGVQVRFPEAGGSSLLRRGLPPERKPYDVLHLHWFGSFVEGKTAPNRLIRGAMLARELKRRQMQGIRLIWTVHDLHDFHQRMLRFWDQRCSEIMDHLIVHSDYARQQVLQTLHIPEEKISVVPHAHYVDCYTNTIPQFEARAELGIPQDNLVFLYFGRIHNLRGLPRLFKAFSHLPEPNATLLVAGSPATSDLANYVLARQKEDPRIQSMLGRVSDEDLQIYMNASDAVVLPLEPMPGYLTSGTVIAAMSFQRAVIAPSMGAVTSVVPEDGGLLYEPHNDSGLEEALKKAREVDLEGMGQRNLARIRQFDWDQMALKTKKVYDGSQ